MQMLYNSDSFVVVQFVVPGVEGDPAPARGGYEIVDKFARKDIYLRGAVAETFQRGVQALVDSGQAPESMQDQMDEFIAGFTSLAQQPLTLH